MLRLQNGSDETVAWHWPRSEVMAAPSLGRSPDVSCVCELPYPPASKYYIKSTDNDKNIAFKPKIFHLLVCGEAAQQEAGPVPHHVLRAALSLCGLSEHDMRSLD